MNEGNPKTLVEWQRYVNSLSQGDLFEAAEGAARVKFGQVLLAEGYTAQDVTLILSLFASRFVDLGVDPPSWQPGMIVDYRTVLQRDPP
jgi:hypothetical protein